MERKKRNIKMNSSSSSRDHHLLPLAEIHPSSRILRVNMKSLILAATFSATVASAVSVMQIPHPYIPPGSGDYRSPCPALNTLANHGYLPRTGLHWEAEAVAKVLHNIYNIEPSTAS